MNRSVRSRYRISSATEIILIPCPSQNSTSCGTRAMLPSSFITSQMTPDGCNPAIRARSTEASVCPARTSTPPSRDRSGNTCPGRARSSACVAGSIATWMVFARSYADTPVVTPSRPSIVSVNAVPNRDVLLADISGSRSSSHRSGVSVRQISPRPCVTMKLMISGVIFSAATVKSPSFSRSSSSTTTSMRPARISSIASGMEANGIMYLLL